MANIMGKRAKREYLILINPSAGLLNPLHKAADALPALRREFAGAEFVETRSEAHAARVLKAAARMENPPRVVVAGGDGTFHHAAQHLAGSGVELALIPAGSANNVASCLGIPVVPEEAAAVAHGARARPLDIGRCGKAIFIEAAGVGFHASAMQRYGLRDRKSLVRAIYSAARTAAELQPFEATVVADGRFLERRIFQMTISNLPMYGTNFRPAPDANPADGLLDVTLIPEAGALDAIPILYAARSGQIDMIPGVETFRCAELTIRTDSPIPVHLDAFVKQAKTIKISCGKAALNVVRP